MGTAELETQNRPGRDTRLSSDVTLVEVDGQEVKCFTQWYKAKNCHNVNFKIIDDDKLLHVEATLTFPQNKRQLIALPETELGREVFESQLFSS